ncbi:zinc ribbon domain-containing protein [Porphyromonas gingivalis]|uniref:zinc ribbon domain-containing protein n=1 Tax=Porphyromonas gingivalis TaxID=837 RepID=UPI00097CE08A|nr:C4-type zinc ribbon domain-containing protein [Porphyromonas gingivalis]SJM18607.1 hypothetical protein PGIN_13-1_00424 [Porphyromonas gingivalis]
MAKEKIIVENEQSVEEKLVALSKLQNTLSEIDKIKTLRGELPLEVQDLEDEIAGMQTRLENFTAGSKQLNQAVTTEKEKISTAKTLLEKYKKQLDEVRNNREFDNLSKEIEFQELEVQLSEKKIKEYNVEIQQRKTDIATLKEVLEEHSEVLAEKRGELDTIIAETKQEEEKLREKAKKLEAKIEPRLLTAFKRIRKAAHNGLAVVPVERDACGGCFNKIPPQKQLDVKLRKKIIVCEYCGRIMVDPEMGA